MSKLGLKVPRRRKKKEAFEFLVKVEGGDLDMMTSVKVKCGEQVKIFLPMEEGKETDGKRSNRT